MPSKFYLNLFFATALFGSVIIYLPIAADQVNRRTKAQIALEQVHLLWPTVYQPEEAVELWYREGVRAPNYLNDCFGGGVTAIYETELPVEEIKAIYQQELEALGWRLHEGYRPDNDYWIYTSGPDNRLTVTWNGQLEVPDPPVTHFPTVYEVSLMWTFSGCYG
jgi:hypothetical protein